MKIRKALSILLSLCMMLTCMPVAAFAEGVTGDASHISTASAEAAVCHDDVTSAGADLRTALLNRAEKATIQYQIPATQYPDVVLHQIAYNILTEAFEHTGVPNEGDYLYWSCYNWDYSVNHIALSADEAYYTADIDYTFIYFSTAEQEEEVTRQIEQLLTELNLTGTDYENIRTIYTWICDNVEYDHERKDDPTYLLKHSTYAALVERKAVCQGYTLLLYRLMLAIGIDCRIISGLGGCFLEMFENYESHGWNIVQLDGLYYNVDATWDAGEEFFSWFLRSDASFSADVMNCHKRDDRFLTEEFYAAYPMAQQDNPYEEAISGICGDQGDNLTWVLHDGVLTISGSGKMMDCVPLEAPWWGAYQRIHKIVVEEGVETIGMSAFYCLTALKEVSLPKSLKEIGYNAFAQCILLESIFIPDSVDIIGPYCFACCYALEEVRLPRQLKQISEYSFGGCENLKEIIIPETVERIEDHAFSATALQTISFPSSLISIGSEAFFGTRMENVYIPENIEYIGGGAFSGRYSKSITVSEENTYYTDIDGVLFTKDLLTLVSYPGGNQAENYVIPEGTLHIDDSAFDDSWFLKNITLPSSLKTIGRRSFSTCRIQSLTFPENLISVGDEAFLNNIIITSVHIPADIAYGEGVFSGCWNLTTVTTAYGLKEIAPRMFSGSGITSIELAETVEVIGEDAFGFCDELTSVSLPDSVKTIGACAFWHCSQLCDITLGCGITEIGQQAFQECTSLSDVYYGSTQSSWDRIRISDNSNDPLLNATIHFSITNETAPIPGDLNGDRTVDVADACLIVMYYSEQLELTEDQLSLADLDGNGRVDLADAYRILMG